MDARNKHWLRDYILREVIDIFFDSFPQGPQGESKHIFFHHFKRVLGSGVVGIGFSEKWCRSVPSMAKNHLFFDVFAPGAKKEFLTTVEPLTGTRG